MSSINTKAMGPMLRFPEFKNREDWKLMQISEILYSESSFLALNKLDLKESGYLIYGADGIVGYINSFQFNEPYISIVKDGSGVGRLNLCDRETSILGTLSCLKSTDEMKYKLVWAYFLLSTLNFSSYVKGAGIPHIYFSDIRRIPICVPKPDEQQKIADCLSSIDELITANTQKLDALKVHKKVLMHQLFPQGRDKTPKFRFPEFKDDGDWVDTELNKQGEIINGLTYSPNDVRDTGLLVLRSSNIRDNQIDLNDCVYVNPTIKRANLTQPDDILVCVRNGSKTLIGKNAIIPQNIPLATHGAFMIVFRAKFPKFVFQLFQTDEYNKKVKADLGATINSINGKNFLKYKFLIPKPEEQSKIAIFLSSLDELISAQDEKVKALKAHKKGLMQQLFPIFC